MSNTSDRDPIEELAEQFLAEHRDGNGVSIGDYAARYPQWADRIRQLFPALLWMESHRGALPQTEADGALPPSIGQGLSRLGDFRIVREIGRGGMGVVYEAEQESLGRRVALKVLPAASLASKTRLRRFHLEARAAARLHHTNIVPVFGFGQQDGLHYYVMQYIAGRGLDEVLEAMRRLRDDPTATFDQGTHVAEQPRVPITLHSSSAGEAQPAPDVESPFAAANRAAGMIGSSAAGPGASHAGPNDSALRGSTSADGGVARATSASRASSDSRSRFPAEEAARRLQAGDFSFDDAEPAVDVRPLPPVSARYWRCVARIGAQAADALDYAHRQGTLHRDIKPGNLLLDRRGTVWIADFGLAKLAEMEDLTQSGDIVGTLRYMAPEQFEGAADDRSDVYSLGLTLYELATLRPAFDEEDRGRLLKQISRHDPPRPGRINPSLPRDLETIIVKAIAAQPEHRYQSAGELRDDLQAFLDDRPVRARRVSPLARIWRWCRRNRAVAALSATALALLLVVAAVASVGYVLTQNALRRAVAAQAATEAARARAEAEHDRAESNLRLATRAFDDLTARLAAEPALRVEDDEEDEESWDANNVVTGKDADILEGLLKFYDQFAQQNQANVALQKETAQAYRRAGDIHQRLAQYERAEAAYRHALESYRSLSQRAPDAEVAVAQAAVQNELGVVLRMSGQFSDVREYHRQALAILEREKAPATQARDYRYELARTHAFLSTAPPPRHHGGWPHAPGERPDRPELAAGSDHPPPGPPKQPGPPKPPDSPGGPHEHFRGHWGEGGGFAYRDRGRRPDDRPPDEPAPKPAPLSPPGERRFPRGDWAQRDRTERNEAAEHNRQALELLEGLVAEEPNNPRYRLAMARSRRDRSMIDARDGHFDDAEASRQKALALLEGLVQDYPANPEFRCELVETYAFHWPTPHDAAGRERAVKQLRAAIEQADLLLSRSPGTPQFKVVLARAHNRLAEMLQGSGQLDEARAQAAKGVALSRELAQEYASTAGYRFGLVMALQQQARVQLAHDDRAGAAASLKEVLTELRTMPQSSSAPPPFFQAMEYGRLARTFRSIGETALADEASHSAETALHRDPPAAAPARLPANDKTVTPSAKVHP